MQKKLDDIYFPIFADLTKVRRIMDVNLDDDDAFSEVGSYLSERKGKNVRAALVLFSRRLFGTQMEEAISIGAACELIHLATLLHDDVLDEAESRRGGKTVNVLHGNKMSILMGDFLYCRAFHLIPEQCRGRILMELLSGAEIMCQGEALEIMHTWDTSLNCESYQDIISKKTAIFFEKCVRCGGILGNTTEENIEHLGQFAQLMGLVFQMTDDLLDLETTSEILGKTVMQDVREGHYTSAVILALANPEHGPRLKSLLETREDPGNGEKIREILTASNAFAQARERILELVAEAEQELQKVTDVVDETARQALLELLYFVIHRAH